MEIVIRATIVFWILWLLLRASGKRELAQMTPFELIVLMVLGDIIQQATTEEDMSVVGGALAATTIMLWAVGISYAAFRSKPVRGVLEDRPTIVVAHGEIDDAMLKVERLTREELSEEARNAGIADIADIEWGLLEADGRFSFITKQGNRPPPPGHDVT